MSKRVQNALHTRTFQEEMDVYRAFLLTSLRAHSLTDDAYREADNAAISSIAEEIRTTAAKCNFEKQKETVFENVFSQCCKSLTAQYEALNVAARFSNQPSTTVSNGSEGSVGGSPISLPNDFPVSSPLGMGRTNFDFHDTAGMRQVFGRVRRELRLRLGFSLHIEHSEAITNAKLASQQCEQESGVFLEGAVVPGTLVAFYPGWVYNPPDLRKMENFPRIDRDNDYLFARTDTVIVDGKNTQFDISLFLNDKSFKRLQKHSWSWSESSLDLHTPAPHLSHCCPLGQGHMINHPPEGHEPNVIAVPVDVPRSLPPALRAVLPNREYHRQGRWGMVGFRSASGFSEPAAQRILGEEGLADGDSGSGVLVRTVVLVALRPIGDGEELFLDYRYAPRMRDRWPSWYRPVDEEEAERRWQAAAWWR